MLTDSENKKNNFTLYSQKRNLQNTRVKLQHISKHLHFLKCSYEVQLAHSRMWFLSSSS